jgi:NTE family protein
MARLALGVALSGGTAKSVTHVGVLKALAEAGIPISHIAGTSGGSIVSTMYASGMPVSTMEAVATTMSWRKLASIRLTRLGFISSEPIENFVRETIGDLTFEDLNIPSAVVATNLVTGDRKVFNSGPVARAVRASCSIPQVYLPVEIDGEYYVDGGLAEYLPIDSLRETGARFLVGSHLGPVDPTYRRPHHILQLVLQVTGLMARKNYVVSEKQADFIIHPNLDPFSSFDFDKADHLIEIGYRTTVRMLDSLRAEWDAKSSLFGRLARRFKGGP